jgi:putative ABC transport system ATP-binding protein
VLRLSPTTNTVGAAPWAGAPANNNNNRNHLYMTEITPGSILRADRLVKQVTSPEGTLTILDGVSLSVARGESLAIVGASGSGKSTLLGLLAGLDTPTSGEVRINGIEITKLDEDGRALLRAANVGFVFQSFQLLASLTALENVMLPLELGGMDAPDRAAHKVLDEVGLSERVGHYPHQLSGGEQQRVALARAFGPKPALLFADEPTGNLDARTGAKVIDLLFSMNAAQGTTLVLVTHDNALAQRCDRVVEIDAGRFVNGDAG